MSEYITIKRAELERALEALEDAKALLNNKDRTTTMWFADEITALRAALAQQALSPQEPVGRVVSAYCEYATVQWLKQTSDVGGGDPKNSRSWPIAGDAVYIAPPHRKPLTEEEIESCRQQGYAHAGLSAPFDFGKAARAIERKVRGDGS